MAPDKKVPSVNAGDCLLSVGVQAAGQIVSPAGLASVPAGELTQRETWLVLFFEFHPEERWK